MVSILLFLLVGAAQAGSGTCQGIVATPAQRDAYMETMTRCWPRADQTAFLRRHEAHIKTSEDRALRGEQEFDAKLGVAFTVMCSGLNKLPDYRGWVFRRVDLSNDQINLLKSKGIFTDRAFMSTSTSDVLVWKKNTMLKIFTRHGKNLMGVTAHPEEKEVLLLPQSRFKVHRFKENPAGSNFRYEITLKEADSLDI